MCNAGSYVLDGLAPNYVVRCYVVENGGYTICNKVQGYINDVSRQDWKRTMQSHIGNMCGYGMSHFDR